MLSRVVKRYFQNDWEHQLLSSHRYKFSNFLLYALRGLSDIFWWAFGEIFISRHLLWFKGQLTFWLSTTGGWVGSAKMKVGSKDHKYLILKEIQSD